MNRIILIGNGFDLAHGLKTKYTDFVNSYWRNFAQEYPKTEGGSRYEDQFIRFENTNGPKGGNEVMYIAIYMGMGETKGEAFFSFIRKIVNITSYQELKQLITETKADSHLQYELSFKNKFWGHICEKYCLETWVDIENEYYTLLKDFLREHRRYANLWLTVNDLNNEFCEVKNMLEKYLTNVCNENIEIKDCIEKYTVAGVRYKDIAISKRKLFFDAIPNEKGKISMMVANAPSQYNHLKRMTDQQLNGEIEQSIKRQGISVLHTLVLNFNYTKTAEKYSPLDREYDHEDYGYNERPEYDTVNIHGELKSSTNPIIFGYGDELDEDYKAIEKTNDNDFLDNIKSIQYHNTGNYRKLLSFLEDEPYQVFIMGHSCGNSDRTLLNTIFEHENCISIKPFFYQWKDDKTGELKDNYTELTKNISRNFNDKQKMRDVVVNREYCLPLVPCAEDVKTPADV